MQRLIASLAFASLITIASAQSNGNGASASAGAADQQWQSVKNKGEPIPSANAADPSVRSQAVAEYLADANALQDFYTKHPDHAEAKEAKRREALALLYARSLGDTSQAARCQQLVTELRQDPAIDVEHREQLAAFSDNLDVEGQHLGSPTQLLAGYEQTARALQKEFPGSSTIYESLVGIAQSSADDNATKIAHDVLGMPAPDEQKARAQVLLNRLGLKGASLTDLANGVLGSDNPIGRAFGQPVVVYTWSSSTPELIAVIKNLAAKAPAGTAFVGVCVDMGDLSAAHARAASDQPPGDLLYDPMGIAGRFAGRAQMNAPGLVFVADRKGRIVSVSAQRDLAALLNTLSNL